MTDTKLLRHLAYFALAISLAACFENNTGGKFGIGTNSETTTLLNGTFQDAQGDTFQDVLRYTCYDQQLRGMSISSQLTTATSNSTGDSVSVPMASKFCVTNASTQGGAATAGCLGQPSVTDYSSQSYYYNLFIRDSERGDINFSNTRYHCPTVIEALGSDGSVGTQNKPWPLDRSFALALGKSSSFSVGVQTYTKLSNGAQDPTSANSTCDGNSSTNTNPNLVSSCLGFAAPPNADGTCSPFVDTSGTVRYMYRLRKYIAIYPPIFDTNGQPLAQTQSSDTIFVLDRPVAGGPNPLQPYTMAGPKPCPFSFYDRTGVAWNGATDTNYPATSDKRPGYLATNNSNWTGTNVDGIEFPNVDTVNSCAAVIPVLSADKSIISLATVSSNNPVYQHVYVRPITAWAPHYLEDTSFQACAPVADSPEDPPLHFAKDPVTGNIGYCAEVYPTQNPNVAAVDPYNGALVPPSSPGFVSPYTSHVVKNTTSADCTPTVPTLPTDYPAATGLSVCGAGTPTAYARHPADFQIDANGATNLCANKSCDRTVVSQPQDWLRFPLLAPPSDIENAIVNDLSSYGCTITYDNGSGKAGVSSPSGGCCGASVLMSSAPGGNTSAHLEPDVSCLTPTY